MPLYENRLPPEGINSGKTNMLLEVFWLLAGTAAAIVALVVILYFAGGFIAKHTPFAWEVAATSRFIGEADDKQSKALQALAARLTKGMDLPEGMSFNIHYIDDKEINAFATLGGHIRLHRGLLEQLHSENAVAMVLAHEMAHVIHRDAAQASGGRLLVAAALGMLAFATGADSLSNIINPVSNITLMRYSRAAEAAADKLAVEMLARHYGHMGGTEEVFIRLKSVEDKEMLSLPEFMNTHPETASRLAALEELAQKQGIPLTGKLTDLPPVLRSRAE